MMSAKSGLLCVFVWFGVGCVERPTEKKIDPLYVEANLLATVPDSMSRRFDARLNDSVVYLGNDVDTLSLSPGGQGRVIHYWQVLRPPGAEWRVFSHLIGSDGQWINLDVTDMRIGHPPSAWRAEEIVRDEQTFQLPTDWRSQTATLAVGLYKKGGTGVVDRMNIAGEGADSERRLLAASFNVENSGTADQDTVYTVRRANGPIVVDGVAREPAWTLAPRSREFRPTEGGKELLEGTRARLLWDDVNLYAFVEVDDRDVASQYKKDDEPMWKEDVIEFFLDADGNGRGYIELQVNPHNARFDAWFAGTRGQGSDLAWQSGMTSAVVVHGTIDSRADVDKGWDVEVAIPLRAVWGPHQDARIGRPPNRGDRWRINVVRGEKPAGAALMASSWNPIPVQDFHALDRMLTIILGGDKAYDGGGSLRETGASSSTGSQPPTPTGVGR